MSFIDETITTAKEIFDVASKKTTEAVEVQKLRISIVKKKSELSKIFETLGRTYYESTSGHFMEEVLAQIVGDAESALSELHDLEAQLDAAKKVQVCSSCGQKNPAGSDFCNSCGTAFHTNETTEPASSTTNQADDSKE